MTFYTTLPRKQIRTSSSFLPKDGNVYQGFFHKRMKWLPLNLNGAFEYCNWEINQNMTSM